MSRLFAVIRSQGPAWKVGQPLEAQRDWRNHAHFMDGLASRGFVVIGGPLEGTEDVLLIIRAAHEAEIRARLGGDPWGEDMLTLGRIAPWTLRLGEQNLATGA